MLTPQTLGIEMTRVFTLEDTAAILDTFQKHGHKELILLASTARVHPKSILEISAGKTGDW